MENLSRYIIRASFSQERMTYVPEKSRVIYKSKDGKGEKIFDALEWLAAMCSHVPNKGEQMVRYYGHYSNVARGKRKKQDQDRLIPSILEPKGVLINSYTLIPKREFLSIQFLSIYLTHKSTFSYTLIPKREFLSIDVCGKDWRVKK